MQDVDDHLLPVQESVRHELARAHGDRSLFRHFSNVLFNLKTERKDEMTILLFIRNHV